ncbi:kinase-like domain-containing protein, partial [Rhizophagus diaphanus]
MEYANKSNLRGCLTDLTNNWEQKLYSLYKIIAGLNNLHREGLIHCNLHDGNILCNQYGNVCISDYLGSYQFAKYLLKKNNIYGVIPFVAPEVLRGKPCTPASDIYSFSIIMWEFTSGIPPFNDRAHDIQLASSICKGERPEIIENIPQCYIDLMKKCWNEDPSKRPSASEILDTIK